MSLLPQGSIEAELRPAMLLAGCKNWSRGWELEKRLGEMTRMTH